MKKKTMTDFQKLIPDLSGWVDTNGNPISVESWINGQGSFAHAIAYGVLFWPEFMIYDDCIFFQSHFDEKNYRGWMEKTHDKTAAEKVINHRHVVDYFPNSVNPTLEQINYVGELLKEIWGCKLRNDFPERNIVVDFLQGENLEDDIYDFELIVYQNR